MANQGLADSDLSREDIMRMFLKSHDMLSAYLYSKVESWELVEEAIQETTVFLCSHWDEFEPGTNFDAWIRTVAYFRCKKALRFKSQSGRLKTPESQLVFNSIASEEWDSCDESTPQLTKALHECIGKLPESQRKLLEMHYQEEKTYEQMAATQDKSIDTLYVTLSRIRNRLRLCLEQRMTEPAI